MNKKEHKSTAPELATEPIREGKVVVKTNLDVAARHVLSRKFGEELVLLSNAIKEQEETLTAQSNAL